jgi:hypothetical protein
MKTLNILDIIATDGVKTKILVANDSGEEHSLLVREMYSFKKSEVHAVEDAKFILIK